MTTITQGATTITPTLVLGYAADSDTGNVFHEILGREDLDVTLRDEGLRVGRLSLFFATEAEAFAGRDLHSTQGTFTLVDDDVPELNMTYVRRDRMTIRLDPQTRQRWLLDVGFQEVLA